MGLVIFLSCERLWLGQKGLTPVPILQTELHYFLNIVTLTVFLFIAVAVCTYSSYGYVSHWTLSDMSYPLEMNTGRSLYCLSSLSLLLTVFISHDTSDWRALNILKRQSRDQYLISFASRLSHLSIFKR